MKTKTTLLLTLIAAFAGAGLVGFSRGDRAIASTSCYLLMFGLKEPESALPYCFIAGEQGSWFIQGYLGSIHLRGDDGALRDYAKAAKWYRLSAEQGDIVAQVQIGRLYYSGAGVPKDDAEAAKWFRAAAEQDYSYGQNYLGFMYEEGKGVEQDAAEAQKWYRLAAAQGRAGRAEAQKDLEEFPAGQSNRR